ncbi:MAG TPA: sulfotransferase [Steroidobacteraceae bacterium]|nr:sulfotransferase [Steroidobacteraceae bacterium]
MFDVRAELTEVRRLITARRGNEAYSRSRALTNQHADEIEAWSLFAWSALGLNRVVEALAASDRAQAIGGQNPGTALCRAICLHRLGKVHESTELLRSIVGSPFSSGWEYGQLGELLARCEQYDLAAEAYTKAVAAEPADADLHYNRATVQRFIGDFPGAEKSCADALRLRPHDPDACYLLSGLSRQSRERNHVKELLEARGLAQTPRAISSIEYALAKEYEDLGDFDVAFHAMTRAGAVRRSHMQYDVAQDEKIIAAIIATFQSTVLSAVRGPDCADEPIFIVGLPRTGTTLLERILCNSPEVRRAGERSDLGALVTALTRRQSGGRALNALETVRQSVLIDHSELGRRYVTSVNEGRQGGARFIDKFPLNYLYIGLIHLALPRACILHMVRDPMDTCLAIYKQRFENAHPYSYDLDDIGRYFVAYRKLMSHWRATSPGRIVDVSYEELARDPDGTCSSVFSHCRLTYLPSYASEAPQGHAITTASAVQARRSIYTSSIGSWRNYERHLGPLFERLRRADVC